MLKNDSETLREMNFARTATRRGVRAASLSADAFENVLRRTDSTSPFSSNKGTRDGVFQFDDGQTCRVRLALGTLMTLVAISALAVLGNIILNLHIKQRDITALPFRLGETRQQSSVVLLVNESRPAMAQSGGIASAFLIPVHHKRCIDGWKTDACYAPIVALARARQAVNSIFVVIAAGGSYDIILNWCASMRRLGLDNYLIVALDDDAYVFLHGRHAPVVLLPPQKNQTSISKGDVWVFRTYITYMILKAGIDVVVSDADAILVRSPFADRRSFFYDQSLDIIASPSNFPNPQNRELPDECPRPPAGRMEWRHQPCMGWIMLRSSENMIVFFERLFLPGILQYRDDQIAFNCAVRQAGAMWKEGARPWTPNATMQTRLVANELSMIMLSSTHFVRNCTENEAHKGQGYGLQFFDEDQVQMYHCKGYHKRENAQVNGFWFLSRDFDESLKPTLQYSSFNSFLDSISSINTSLIVEA